MTHGADAGSPQRRARVRMERRCSSWILMDENQAAGIGGHRTTRRTSGILSSQIGRK